MFIIKREDLIELGILKKSRQTKVVFFNLFLNLLLFREYYDWPVKHLHLDYKTLEKNACIKITKVTV